MSKKAEATKAVAKAGSALITNGFDFAADAGAGMEGADKDSYAIPFLRVLQTISPQCDEAEAEYIKGAKGGMLFESVSSKLYDGKKGVTFLPCAFQRRFLQWGPRGGEGAGFHGELLPEEVAEMRASGAAVELDGRLYIVKDGDKDVSDKRNDRLADTRSHFGLLVEDGIATPVLLALSSTQIKKSKQLMSMLSNARVDGPNGKVTPPTWMNRITITTVPESNDQGKWHGVKFEADGFIDSKALYETGKAFHASVSKGKAKAVYADDDAADSSDKF